MGLFGWLRKRPARVDARVAAWRDEWALAVSEPGPDRLAALRGSLDALGYPEEEIEVEREMLDGLEQLDALRASIAGGSLPVVTTGHRVVAQDVCHFSAPASMPDDPAQPSGRLIVTNARAIFVGGARSTVVPWHAVLETVWTVRDVVLVKHDRETLYRFRCNSYADALCSEFLARHLAAARRRPPGGRV
jgi:hypothetical protein